MKRCVKHQWWFVAAFAVLSWAQDGARADWAAEISDANPVNWFRFEDSLATVANDQGSADMNGTYEGSVVLGNPGLVGQAASFNTGGHVFIGGANLAADWTLETIFKASTGSGGFSMGLIGVDYATTSDRMAIKAEQANWTGQLGYTRFGVVDVTFSEAAAATPVDFAHVVFVGQNTGVSLYVNGAFVGADATSTSLARGVIAAGAILPGGTISDPLTGMIDELVIYDRALSSSEISAHFSSIPEPSVLTSLAVMGGLFVLSLKCGLRRR